MTPLSKEERAKLMAKSNQAQRNKFGKDYSEEMRRRAGMRKTFGTGGFRYMKEHDPERLAKIIADREAKRKFDRTQES